MIVSRNKTFPVGEGGTPTGVTDEGKRQLNTFALFSDKVRQPLIRLALLGTFPRWGRSLRIAI